MCGRFSLSQSGQKISDYFDLDDPVDLKPQYNIHPGQDILIIRLNHKNKKEPTFTHWGLIPPWQKEEDIRTKWINARSETIIEKRLFKNPLQHRRCLIIADGFYEWSKTKIKKPYYFHLKNNHVFGFAGIWEHWKSKSGKIINSCCILTTSANKDIKPIHDRMPVIIPKEHHEQWLHQEIMDATTLNKLVKTASKTHLLNLPISTYVNNPEHNDKKCIEPLIQPNIPT